MTTAISPVDLMESQARIWAQFQSAYSQCSEDIRCVVDEMASIVNDPAATPDEKDAAVHTIVEAVFPALAEDIADLERTHRERDADDVIADLEREQACFADRVSKLMTSKGLTQAELAEAVGVTQSAVANMLARKSRPQRKTIARFAAALGVSPDQLVDADGH